MSGYRDHPIMDDRCIVCGSACPPYDNQPSEKSTRSCMRRGGGTIELGFGYGSRNDTVYLIGVICDPCAKTLVETAAAAFTSAGALGPPRWANVVEAP